jgi:glycosyltransferase involved in cell wall biosynthesis
MNSSPVEPEPSKARPANTAPTTPDAPGVPDTPDTTDATCLLGVAVCTQDNIDTIERCLRTVRAIAHEIVVVDSGSTDGTVELARSLGARVVHHDWEGMVGQRRFALEQVRGCGWVLLLDSDESIDAAMAESIARAVRQAPAGVCGYEMRRMVWFLGGWLRHTFQPEWRLRLVRPEAFSITGVGPGGAGGHDRISVTGRTQRLDGLCRHDTWRDLDHLFERQIFFAARAARYSDRGGRLSDIVFRPALAVFKQFVLKGGFRDGPRGVIACFGVGVGVTMKHIYIMKKRRLGDVAPRDEPSGDGPPASSPGATGGFTDAAPRTAASAAADRPRPPTATPT